MSPEQGGEAGARHSILRSALLGRRGAPLSNPCGGGQRRAETVSPEAVGRNRGFPVRLDPHVSFRAPIRAPPPKTPFWGPKKGPFGPPLGPFRARRGPHGGDVAAMPCRNPISPGEWTTDAGQQRRDRPHASRALSGGRRRYKGARRGVRAVPLRDCPARAEQRGAALWVRGGCRV
eukprot:scaffold2162_cov398-Prasinococcus_capsulatus_cf.AAC.15